MSHIIQLHWVSRHVDRSAWSLVSVDGSIASEERMRTVLSRSGRGLFHRLVQAAYIGSCCGWWVVVPCVVRRSGRLEVVAHISPVLWRLHGLRSEHVQHFREALAHSSNAISWISLGHFIPSVEINRETLHVDEPLLTGCTRPSSEWLLSQQTFISFRIVETEEEVG